MCKNYKQSDRSDSVSCVNKKQKKSIILRKAEQRINYKTKWTVNLYSKTRRKSRETALVKL